MEEKKLVPKLRFPGFTEPWEQRKLGEEAIEILAGGDIEKEKVVYDSGYPIYANALTNDGLVGYYTDYYRVEAPAVTVTGRGEVGHAQARSQNFTPIVRLLAIRSKHDCYFLENAINNYKTIVESTGVPQLTVPQLSAYKLCFPLNIEEEKRISICFQNLDTLITLHQRKLEHLKLKKKSLLQKLFPKEGEVYPELRFPGFTAPWEQRKLGDMGKTFNGLAGKTKEDFGHGAAQYVTYLNVFQNTMSDLSMTEKIEIDKSQNEVQYGDILFTTSSETPEEVGMSSVWLGKMLNTYLNSFCFGYRPMVDIDHHFIGNLLRSSYVRNKMKILAQGISRYNISKNKVMDLEIALPSKEEQKLIGSVLNYTDNLITLHQRKLEHLQLLKKALLQQLFV